MPLLQTPAAGGSTGGAAEKTGSRSEKNKAWAEKKKAQKKAVIAYLKTLPNVPANIKEILNEWENGAQRSSSFGPSTFAQLFGEGAKAGASVTLAKVLDITKGKGIEYMAGYIKKWKKDGTIVEFVPNDSDFRQSSYVVKAVG